MLFAVIRPSIDYPPLTFILGCDLNCMGGDDEHVFGLHKRVASVISCLIT